MSDLLSRFQEVWADLSPIGRCVGGGYERFSWTKEDDSLRSWFRAAAADRGLEVEQDRNANLWAWWGHDPVQGLPREQVVAVGSHLDSVPRGGAYDGPLGVVSAFLALDELRVRHSTPPRPIAVVDFVEEEGARFGVACLGSRLATGALDPDLARALIDAEGVTLADAMRDAGEDAGLLGADEERLARLMAFVELHVEQGRFLEDVGKPIGVATQIWPHGRWRLRFDGEANHAGTARLSDRSDPMMPFASAIVAAREAATDHGGLATVGRVRTDPNGTNVVPASVDAWLDARAPDDAALESIVADVQARVAAEAVRHRVTFSITEESRTEAVSFDVALRSRIVHVLGDVPEMHTGAGHDAGILASTLPTAMLFVRNPTGISHSREEHASDEDCAEGIRALAAVLEALAWE